MRAKGKVEKKTKQNTRLPTTNSYKHIQTNPSPHNHLHAPNTTQRQRDPERTQTRPTREPNSLFTT